VRGLALLFVAGCARFDAQPVSVDAGPGPDGTDGAATVDAVGCTLGPWGTPRHLTGVNSGADEGGPALSADKLTLYFESSRSGNFDLYRATRDTTHDDFGAVTPLAALNTGFDERDPNLSADQLTLYFTNNKYAAPWLFRATRNSPTEEFTASDQVNELAGLSLAGPALRSDGGELFFSDWTGTTLGHATYGTGQGFVFAGTVSVDVGGANASPSLSSDGLTLYYQHKQSAIDPLRIYAATRPDVQSGFASAMPIAAFDDPRDTGNPEISRDGKTMVFASNRSGGTGGYDLYIADRECQ
jgi:Tol biopolymer transport system component